MDSPAYQKLNRAWSDACRVLLGAEVGELENYREWLSGAMDKLSTKKSALSGKEVQVGTPHYCKGAKFISLDEVDFNKRFEPLSINEVKDVDSIVEAIGERFVYTGNIILNNSREVEKSSNISNSFFILESDFIVDSKELAYCSHSRYSKDLFGVNNDVLSSYVIRGLDTQRIVRCFESWAAYKCSDLYYTFNTEDCADLMFCFNLRNARNRIGNLQLTKEKYSQLKEKLIAEIREELSKNGRCETLLEMACRAEPEKVRLNVEAEKEPQDMSPMEKSFRSVSKVVLGRELHNLPEYEKWMMEHNWFLKRAKSAVSGKPTYITGMIPYRWLPEGRIVKQVEALELGKRLKLSEREIGSFERMRENLGRIAYFRTELRLEENVNLLEAPFAYKSVNCYFGPVYSESENCGFCSWPRTSRNVFGSHMAFSSNSCIKCCNSVSLARCFEVDGSANCSDLYFSHNCENANDSMFCFNVKNARRSIGNAEYPQEEYKRIKGSLLEQLSEEIESTKSLRWSVFNIGCAGK